MRLDTSFNGVVSLVSVFLFLTTAAVALRLVSRRSQKARYWIDDLMAVAAWFGFVGMATAVLYGVSHKFIGYPEPKSKAVVNAVHPTMELTYVSLNACSIWAFGTAKLCALFFYRRIFCTRVKRDIFDYAVWALIGVVSAWIVAFVVFTFEVCPGHSIHWWIQPGRIGSCQPNLDYPYLESFAITDFALDVLVFGLAFPKIWSIQLSTAQKVGITGIFLLALGGVGASCTRLVIVAHLIRNGRAFNDLDGYQANTQAAYYSLLEGGLSVLCVNLPTIWYFIAGVKPERVLEAVRSLVSLASGSDRSTHSKSRSGSVARQGSLESHKMREIRAIEQQQHLDEMPKGQKQADNNVEGGC